MNGLFVQDQFKFQAWVFELVDKVVRDGGFNPDNIYYPGVPEPDKSAIPQDSQHVRVWVRSFTASPTTMASREQGIRHANTGAVYVKVNHPAGRPELLTGSRDLGILLQRAFQQRNHPCGVIFRNVVPDEVGKVDNDPYYQILVTARYEYDDFF